MPSVRAAPPRLGTPLPDEGPGTADPVSVFHTNCPPVTDSRAESSRVRVVGWWWDSRSRGAEHMSMTKCEVVIYWSADDDGFIAEVPELPGCAADGRTHEEALHNVERIVDEWIDTAGKLGGEIPEPRWLRQYK